MKKWEHKHIKGLYYYNLVEELDAYGNDGWEVISVIPKDDGAIWFDAILKKERSGE